MAILLAEGTQALITADPVRYGAVQAGDVVMTPDCAIQQLQAMADQIRALGGP